MATAQQFEDLTVWQEAKQLVVAVYALTRTGALAKDFGLRDQLQRAAVSVMSNIAEGFERGTNREFVQYLHIAKGSAGEVRSLLTVAAELGFVKPDSFASSRNLCLTVSRRLSSLIKYLQSKKPVSTAPPAS